MPQELPSSDALSPLERFLVGYSACLPFTPQTRPIVDAIRQTHGIEAPIDRQSLQCNLNQFPPETLEAEVLEHLQQTQWPEDADLFNFLARPELMDALIEQAPDLDLNTEEVPADPQAMADILKHMDPIVLPRILHATGLHNILFQVMARALARYIVVGPMEFPQPIANQLTHRVTTVTLHGETVIMAIANSEADPRKAAREFVKAHEKAFKRSARRRVGPQFARDAWVWATYRSLELEQETALQQAGLLDEPDRETSRYWKIAELYVEMHPNKAGGPPDSPERDQHIQNLIPSLRKARQRFDERFFGPSTDESASPPGPVTDKQP